MKRKLAKLFIALALVVCVGFTFTACNNDDNDDNNPSNDAPVATAKVTSLSVGLVESSLYTLTENTITIEYGGKVNLSGSDFVVTATMDDNTTKTLSLKSDTNPSGYTFVSTISNDNITPLGDDYKLTFGHTDLAEADYKTITVKVIQKTVDPESLNLTWTDSSNFRYDGTQKTVTITNLPDYLDVVSYAGNVETEPNGCIKNSIKADYTPNKYTATATLKVKDDLQDCYALTSTIVSHDWRILRGEIAVPSVDEIMESFTYNKNPQTAKIKDSVKSQLDAQHISASLSGDTTGTDANSYNVTVTFTYTGDDNNYYNLSGNLNNKIGTRSATWVIEQQTINTSTLLLTLGGNNAYPADGLTYNGASQTVYFDLSLYNEWLGTNPILSYSENGTTETNAGTHTATITFTVNNSNYRVSNATVSKDWVIKKERLGVFAKESQTFAYGTTKEYISANAELAPIGEENHGIEFAQNESKANQNALYNILKNAITFEIRESDNSTTAYTGKLNAGGYYAYPVIPANLSLQNYEVESGGCASITITKSNLTISVNNKTNEGGFEDTTKRLALTYDGQAKAYTSSDITATGLVGGDNLANIGLEFLYCKRTFTTTVDAEITLTGDEPGDGDWSSTAPTDAGVYQVKVRTNSETASNYNISCTSGKMLIMKKGVKITINDIEASYGFQANEMTSTLGGDVEYNIGDNSYQYGGLPGDAQGFILSTLDSETASSILSALNITLAGNYSIGKYDYDYDEQDTLFSQYFSGEEIVAVGTYKVQLSESLTNALKTQTNYEFVIVEGDLTVNKATISFSAENANSVVWFVDDELINASYDERLSGGIGYNAWVEKTGSQIIVSAVFAEYGDVVTLTKEDIINASLQSVAFIENAGSYDIYMNLAINDDYSSCYEFANGATLKAVLHLVVSENPFETSTVGEEGETETISVNLTPFGSETEPTGLSFNEFANKTEFNEGDIVSFTLVNATSGDDESGISLCDVDGSSTETKVFAGYIVLYNGVEVDPISENIYVITIAEYTGSDSSLKGLIIKKMYMISTSEGEPQEETEAIFSKNNINVTPQPSNPNNPGGSGSGENPSAYDIPGTIKIGGTDYSTSTSISGGDFYYKLSQTQETITLTVSEEWINQGLYYSIEHVYYEITQTTTTIDIYSFVASGFRFAFGKYLDGDMYLTYTNIYVIPWSEVKSLKLEVTNGYGTVDTPFVGVMDGTYGLIFSVDGNKTECTGLKVNFETGYTNYTYKVTKLDRVTDFDFTLTKTNAFVNGWVIIYDANGEEAGCVLITINNISNEHATSSSSNTDFYVRIGSADGYRYPSITSSTTSVDVACSTESLDVCPEDNNASVVLKNSNGDVLFTGSSLVDYRFKSSGTYTVVITASDGTTQRTITVNVTGDYIPDVKFVIETADQTDTTNKILLGDIEDMNELKVSANSAFKFGIDYENLTYYLVSYVGAEHGLKITTSGGKKYITVNSFVSALCKSELYTMDKTKISTYPVNLEILTDSNDREYVSTYFEPSRGIRIVVKIYLCDAISDVKINLTGDDTHDDTNLYCDITDQEEMTTEGDFKLGFDDNSNVYMFTCVGDIETLGVKVTTDANDDSISYISFTGLESSGLFVFGDEAFDMMGTNGNLILHEMSGVKYVLFYGAITSAQQVIPIYICFCDEDEVPEGLLVGLDMSGSGDETPGDGSGEGTTPSEPSTPVHVFEVTFDADGDGEDEKLDFIAKNLNDQENVEGSDFLIQENHCVVALVGSDHGFKFVTEGGVKYVVMTSFTPKQDIMRFGDGSGNIIFAGVDSTCVIAEDSNGARKIKVLTYNNVEYIEFFAYVTDGYNLYGYDDGYLPLYIIFDDEIPTGLFLSKDDYFKATFNDNSTATLTKGPIEQLADSYTVETTGKASQSGNVFCGDDDGETVYIVNINYTVDSLESLTEGSEYTLKVKISNRLLIFGKVTLNDGGSGSTSEVDITNIAEKEVTLHIVMEDGKNPCVAFVLNQAQEKVEIRVVCNFVTA